MRIGNGAFWHGDCLELMTRIPTGSVDMILCDLPYGTTQNKWDTVIPFDLLWPEYWRVTKSNAVVVLTAAQPFTSTLVMSQINYFKYDWSWSKSAATGHLNAKRRPMRNHEDILVFCRGSSPYFPQGLKEYNKITRRGSNGTNFGVSGKENLQESTNYPRTRLEIKNDGKLHPTQKPVELFEYLIRTYTREGDVVLDNCAGSGTTAIAAQRSNRIWCCIEKNEDYYLAAVSRIMEEL